MKKSNKKNPTPTSKIRIMGRVTHKVDGKVVKRQQNAINTDLFTYLANSLNSVANKAIDDLFTDDEVEVGSTQDGKDGIVIYDNTTGVEEFLTMTTTAGTAVETYGRRWVGTLTATQAREVTELAIGHSLEAGTPPFDTAFATQSFAGISLQSGSNYTVEWEIFIAN